MVLRSRRFNRVVPANIQVDIQNNRGCHTLSNKLDANTNQLKLVFNRNNDIVFREFTTNTDKELKAALIYCEVLTESNVINEHILKSLMLQTTAVEQSYKIPATEIIEYVKNKLVTVGEIREVINVSEIVNYILTGNAVLLIDGQSQGLLFNAIRVKERAISEAESETVVRGPRDGFTEFLKTNLQLIRRRIVSPALKTEILKVGLLSKTSIALVYLEDIVNENVVGEIRHRIESIETDSIIESGVLEEFIRDSAYSPFPLLIATERPDKVAAYILSGHVSIIVDNSPFVLLAPVTFPMFLQSTEDYYNNFVFASAIRLLRFFSLNIALLLPALYIAVTTFHQEMLPTQLLISIASAREGIPFPAFFEAVMMEFTFEILREAGVRLPRPVGQAVSIVGALVIGEAAVTAGLVSPAMVIIVSLTAIASFTLPNPAGSYPVRLLRFPMMALAGILGLFGIMMGLMGILVHLCSLRSFGQPYLAPIAPVIWSDLKDLFIRVPWFLMKKRPNLIGLEDENRQAPNMKPKPPKRR